MTAIRDEMTGAPLGHPTTYPDTYDAALLFPVPRAPQRQEIGVTGALPFTGADTWTAYELTWLDPRGKPQSRDRDVRGTGHVRGTSWSRESVKLYLGAFAQTRFDGGAEVAATIERDLARRQRAELRQVALDAPADVPVRASRGSRRRKPGRIAGGDPALPPGARAVGWRTAP